MNVTLPASTPVDLYAATGITVGAQLKVSNITTGDVRLSTSEVGITDDHIPLGPYEQAVNDVGDSGAWAMSNVIGGVNVKEVV